MHPRLTLAKLLTAGAIGAILLLVATRQPGTGQTSGPFETVGRITPISVRVVNQGVNNGYPSIIRDRQGNLWCAWVSARQKDPLLPYNVSNYEEGDMIVLRSRKQGKWGEPLVLNTNFGVNFSPVVAEDAGDNIVVVWSSRRDGRYRLYSRRVGQDMSMGSEMEVLPAGKLEGRPDLVADGKGALWLVSQSWRNPSQDIVFYRLENGGWRRMPDVASTRAPEFRPRVAVAPDGSVWAAWDAYFKGKYHVRVRRFDPTRNQWGEPEHVPGDGKLDAYAPDLAFDPDGRLWVTYARNEVVNPDYGLRGSKTGRAPRPTVRLVVREDGAWHYPPPATGDEPGRIEQGDLPRIRIGDDGAVWVVWQTLPGHVDWKVTGAVYQGDRWRGPFQFGLDEPVAIEGPGCRADQRASFVIDPAGNAQIAYERGLGPFRNRDVYLREVRLADQGGPGDPELTRFAETALDSGPRTVYRAPKRMITSDAAGIRRQLFMGDLHNHLLVDDGHQGSVDQLFHIHRDRYAMDFGATTSHGDSNKLLISELAHNDALAESLLDTSTFVTIPGFEWTQ
ncbi:MAG: hypothetical protein GY953_03905, partial [bacterium]|nr:hypothetical protein [bacterium]